MIPASETFIPIMVERIVEGFAADLVFLRGDPLADLVTLVNPLRVIAAGRSLENP